MIIYLCDFLDRYEWHPVKQCIKQSRLVPGPAAGGRLRFSGLLKRLIQTGLLPRRVLDGGALVLHTELAWWLRGWLQGLGWQLEGVWVGGAQHWRRERAGRVHICGKQQAWSRTVRVSFVLFCMFVREWWSFSTLICKTVLPTHHHPTPPHQTGSCHQTCSDLYTEKKHSVCAHECSAQCILKRAVVHLTFVLALWDADAWWVALALDPVLDHGLLQILHFLLLPLALLQPALLLWFTEVALQGEFAGRLINLLLKSQLSFQCLQLWILQWSHILSYSWRIIVPLANFSQDYPYWCCPYLFVHTDQAFIQLEGSPNPPSDSGWLLVGHQGIVWV